MLSRLTLCKNASSWSRRNFRRFASGDGLDARNRGGSRRRFGFGFGIGFVAPVLHISLNVKARDSSWENPWRR
jgi:hypothetical protein